MSSFYSFRRTALPVDTPTSEPEGCAPFTMLQGPETWEFHMTVPGMKTRNGACAWTGVFTEVPITCDADLTWPGYTDSSDTLEGVTIRSGSPTVFPRVETGDWSTLRYAVATIVEATPKPTPTTPPANTGDLSGAAETETKTTGSEGRALGASRPTGVMLMVGGAAAIGGAAWRF
jgi:hypothetical protein